MKMTEENANAESHVDSQQEQGEKKPYTDEELKTFTPTSHIEMERVPDNFRPIIENMTRDYKNLAADHTRKAQELAELKKVQEPENYFDDSKKDGVFKDYLKSPLKVISDINSEIAKLEAVIPDDGADEYRKARTQIAYWNGVKDEFSAKRIEVSEKHRQAEIEEAKITAELGPDRQALLEYAKENGISEKDFKSKPALRASVKKWYAADHASETANKKQVKQSPHKASSPAGQSSGGADAGDIDEFDPNLSTEERIALSRKRRAAGG
jgi:hypothetical protein